MYRHIYSIVRHNNSKSHFQMDLSFIKKKWKYKLLGTIIFSIITMVSIYLLKDDELKYIIYLSIMYPAFFALIWLVPISFGILFLETKTHLISESRDYKKYVTWIFRWLPKFAKNILLWSLLLIFSALWILMTFGCLIALGIMQGG